MREVRTCDFCGADATGLYEPLPSSIPGSPRVLLCDGCRDRLESIVDPLLSHLGEDSAGSAGSAEATTSTTDQTSRESGGPEADGNDGAGITARRPSGVADERGNESSDRQAVDSSSERGATSSSGVSAADDTAVSESRDAGGRPQRERAGTPHGYRKVMRFLENREFPIPRTEAVRLASEAYDLDDSAVDACLDHAVQYGRLREVDGELKQ